MVTTTTKTFSNSSTLQLRYLPHRSSRLKSRGGRNTPTCRSSKHRLRSLHQLGGLIVPLALATITVASRQHSDMSDRKIRWAPRLEPGDHISGCDYLGLRELDSSSVDTLLQLSVRWSSLVLATTKVALCLAHWQLLRSADVASYRFAHCSPARWSSLVLATASVAMCQIHWQRLRSADVASTRLRSLLTSTVV